MKRHLIFRMHLNMYKYGKSPSSPAGSPLYDKRGRSRDHILQELLLRLHLHIPHVHKDFSCYPHQPGKGFSSYLPDAQGLDYPLLYGNQEPVQGPHTGSSQASSLS